MNNRILHKTKLNAFCDWIDSQSFIILETKGEYEVFRFANPHDKKICILYKNHTDYITCDKSSVKYVKEFLTKSTIVLPNPQTIINNIDIWLEAEKMHNYITPLVNKEFIKLNYNTDFSKLKKSVKRTWFLIAEYYLKGF